MGPGDGRNRAVVQPRLRSRPCSDRPMFCGDARAVHHHLRRQDPRPTAADCGASLGATRRTPARGIIATSLLRRASSTSSRRARSSRDKHADGNAVLDWQEIVPIRFLGLPYIFNYEELSDAGVPWSPQSVVNTSSMVLWMSEQGPFSYDGTSISAVACPVRPWVDDDIDLAFVRGQACAVHVENFNEFWWFYPQLNQPTNTRCIIYNYKEAWWSMGRMTPFGWRHRSLQRAHHHGGRLVAFQHELLETYGNADLPWAETFDLNLRAAPDDRQATYARCRGRPYRTCSTRCSIAIRAASARMNCNRRRSGARVTAMSTSALRAVTCGCASM